MRWGVLGPLLVTDDAGNDIRVPAGRLRTLLAVLLLRANQPVPLDEIVDVLWDGAPPAAAGRTVRVYVARLRQVLGPGAGARVLTRSRGYLCQVDEDELDLLRFETLCREARFTKGERSWSHTSDALTDALAQWRGEPLADIPSELLRTRACPRLNHLRQQAIEATIDARMNLDQHEQLIPQLLELTDDQPLREHLHAQLMRALARSGRRAEALDAYRRAHRALADQLGIEPGPELRDLHQRILAGAEEQPAAEDGPGQRAEVTGHGGPHFVVPRQLPAAAGHFTGRQAELDTLVGLLASKDKAADTVVISAIDGMAGIGKTALAVHAAHQLADQFADGVLFTDLHGFTPDTEPTAPEQTLDRLLRGLGVPGPRIPPDLDGKVGLYRSVLARRRVLIVLDNADDETQLTPLLPASAGCAAIVTSRRHLAALDDATHLTLPVLARTEAAALFRSLVGNRAVPADEPIVERIVTLCGRLPLAIRIAAARLRLASAATLTALCADLEHALEMGRGLDWLSDGHRAVTAALTVSYRHLTPDQQHALRLAGLHPGQDLEPYALAALADTTVDQAGQLLADLHAASLLDQPAHHRYTLHDLVAAYAGRLAVEMTEPDRHTALDRLYDSYAATSGRAMDLTRPWDADHRPRPPANAVPTPSLPDREQAQAWLDAETDNLVAAAQHAATVHRTDHTLHQSAILHWHLRGRGHYGQAALLHQLALRYAHATADRVAEHDALNGLGHIHRLQSRYGPAIDCFERALDIAHQTRHRTAEHDALRGLGNVHYAQGHYGQATDRYEQALGIAHQTRHRTGEHDALRGLGDVHFARARYGPATDCYQQALDIAHETGDRTGEQSVLRGLGNVHYAQGHYGPATSYYEQALDIARHTGHRTGEHDALRGLGNVHYAHGHYGQATDCYEQALDIARRIGHRNGEDNALRGLGEVHYAQGHYGRATDCYQQTLDIARRTGDRNGQFEAHQGLGRVHHAIHDHRGALRHHQAALRLAIDLDQPADQARAHDGLACAHRALSDPDEARHHWQAVLQVLTSIGTDHTEDPEVTTEAVRARLHALDNPSKLG